MVMMFSEYQKKVDQFAEDYKKMGENLKNNIEKIKNHSDTRIIKYPNHKESFDYVDGLFCNSGVKEVTIYQCNRPFLEKLGYKGVGGFFEKIMKTIVIPDLPFETISKKNDIVAKITIDEVLVHELLHYVSDSHKKQTISMELEEEFAYGNSVGYLKSKGYTNEEIVKNNFMPFLYSVTYSRYGGEVLKEVLQENGYDVSQFKKELPIKQKKIIEKNKKAIHQRTIDKAFKKGMEIIDIYSGKKEEIKIESGNCKFMDFD